MIKLVKKTQNLKDLPSRGMESGNFSKGYKFHLKQVNSVSSEQQGYCAALLIFQKFQFIKNFILFSLLLPTLCLLVFAGLFCTCFVQVFMIQFRGNEKTSYAPVYREGCLFRDSVTTSYTSARIFSILRMAGLLILSLED